MRSRIAASSVAALIACCLTVGGAAAKPSAPVAAAEARSERERAVTIEVSVLHATRGERFRDPRIGDMPELEAGPFKNYERYALLERVSLRLRPGEKRLLELPNGRVLSTAVDELLADGGARVAASINQPGGGEFLPLLEVKARRGQAFIVAGQSYRRGVLVLVFRVLA